MVLNEGDIVLVEGSDTPWIVQTVDKDTLNLLDAGMGIIEIEVPLADVTDVIGREED